MSGLRVERPADGVAMLVLDRAERRNALDDDMLLYRLPETCADLAGDDSVRVVVLAGEGRDFCAGADLSCSGLEQPDVEASQRYLRTTHAAPLTLHTMPKPVIAAISGAAVGAGLGLALACDVRLAAPGARFVAPLVHMGLPPDYATSYLLPRLVGPDAALELFLTGRTVDAEEALRMRLISRIVEDPRAAALDLAVRLTGNAATATAATKRLVHAAAERGAAAAIDDEIRTVATALHGEEFATRLVAWREKIVSRR